MSSPTPPNHVLRRRRQEERYAAAAKLADPPARPLPPNVIELPRKPPPQGPVAA